MIAKICLDRILPEDRVVSAVQRAIAENPSNAPPEQDGLGTHELALNTQKKWRTGRVLTIRFLAGDRKVQARVSEVASQWCEHANLAFDFGDHSEPDIRIAFEDGASWSWVGTDALEVPPEQPTMNFGWLEADSPDKDFHRVVLHEFGHALGCIHEHQSPAGGIPWNLEKVYEYYRDNFNWSEQKTYENLIEKYDVDSTQFDEFDPTSIMIYHVPKELTLGGYEVPWNTELSDKDKQHMRKVYP